MAAAVAASTFLNVGILLSILTLLAPSPLASLSPTSRLWLSPAALLPAAAKLSVACAGIFGCQVPIGLRKIRKLDKQIADLT